MWTLLDMKIIGYNRFVCRRRVSTILESEFRERMDQLILSYIENRGHPPNEQDDVCQNEGPINVANKPQFITPPRPPPPHQLWQQEMQIPLWSCLVHHPKLVSNF